MKRAVLLMLGLLALAPPAHAARARLTAADRAAIDRTLDVFVPAAIARRHPERAFSVVTPHLRQDIKRAEWARGNLPVTPYPAVGKRFDAWTIDGLGHDYVMIDTQLHPRRGSNVEMTNWTIELRKIGGRWLVDSALPTAWFPREGSGSGNMHASNVEMTNWTIELRKIDGRWLVDSALPTAWFPREGSGSGNMHASNDLLPQPNLTRERAGRIGAVWFLVPGAIALLLIGLPIGLWIRSWRRNARAYAAYARRAL